MNADSFVGTGVLDRPQIHYAALRDAVKMLSDETKTGIGTILLTYQNTTLTIEQSMLDGEREERFLAFQREISFPFLDKN